MALTTSWKYLDWIFPLAIAFLVKKEEPYDHCIQLKLIIDNPLTSTAERNKLLTSS